MLSQPFRKKRGNAPRKGVERRKKRGEAATNDVRAARRKIP